LMRLYMERYGATREDMALWPVMMHDNSYHNPYAQLRFKTTIQHVISSPIIADPIRLLDSSPIGDGAAVVILASEEIAKKITDTPIEIAGVGLSTDSVDLATREDLLTARSIRLAAHKAYKMANVEPKYIDVAEVHDAFSINAMLVLEELGFAERGKAWKMLKEGRFRPGDKPTVNPSGGLKARGHPVGATGVYQVAEVAMQLRGDFPGVRVDKAEIGLAQNMGGVAVSTSVIILKR
ncbi:MAG: acetyl-CoA acetyltransferase, partial [Thermoprotei archaeon]